MTSRIAVLIAAALALGSCTCGERERADRRERAAAEKAPPETEPEVEPPPPAARKTADPGAAGASDPRFGNASITFKMVEERPRAQVSVAIPEGASIRDGDV